MEILTERLRLRTARMDDLDAVHRILSDPEAMRYWSTGAHRDVEDSREWLKATVSAPPAESFDFLVEHDGRVVGKAGFWRLPEVGFIFHPDVWGRGVALEALSAVIEAAFARFPIEEATADVDPRNGRCLDLLAKLGFAETGRAENTYFIGGEWRHSVYLARPRRAGDGPHISD